MPTPATPLPPVGGSGFIPVIAWLVIALAIVISLVAIPQVRAAVAKWTGSRHGHGVVLSEPGPETQLSTCKDEIHALDFSIYDEAIAHSTGAETSPPDPPT
jgi:hypothetical protein